MNYVVRFLGKNYDRDEEARQRHSQFFYAEQKHEDEALPKAKQALYLEYRAAITKHFESDQPE